MEKYFKSLQNKKVSVKHIHEFDATGDYEGIQAITYEGTDLDGKKTKVFAYIGYPDCTVGKAPAVKGNFFKGPFHIPRLYMIMSILEEDGKVDIYI